jgi:hypothetical protein
VDEVHALNAAAGQPPAGDDGAMEGGANGDTQDGNDDAVHEHGAPFSICRGVHIPNPCRQFLTYSCFSILVCQLAEADRNPNLRFHGAFCVPASFKLIR